MTPPRRRHVLVPRDQLPRVEAPTEASAAVIAGNFMGATVRTIAAAAVGEPILASSEQYRSRLKICRSCPSGMWEEEARLGLGKCRACGCTRAKFAVAGELCPLGHWPSL